jgi:hypothetical protein
MMLYALYLRFKVLSERIIEKVLGGVEFSIKGKD